MHTEAPYDYIRDYYAHVHRINAEYPDIAEFWLSKLAAIRGDHVLNVGCGPTFYDYMLRFGCPPRKYVGLDINASTFDFLRQSKDPRLLDARTRVRDLGTETELIGASVFVSKNVSTAFSASASLPRFTASVSSSCSRSWPEHSATRAWC